jgi:hypothetical protein
MYNVVPWQAQCDVSGAFANTPIVARSGLCIPIGPHGASASSSAADASDSPGAGSSILSKSFIEPRICRLIDSGEHDLRHVLLLFSNLVRPDAECCQHSREACDESRGQRRHTKRTFMYQSPSRVDEVGASSAGVVRKRRSNFRVHLRTTIVRRKYQGPDSKSLLSHHS